MESTSTNDLFSSLISDIKTYTGNDPLLPWLRGIRKMRDSLPPRLLDEKLPRFLQKCVQAFESDRRYRNDLRYIRIWLQLMDFVDDPHALLTNMERAQIGIKKSLFYQAYALYYEKLKKFEEAEKMYRLGAQNLAEPSGELQKSYEQFLHRVQRHKNKRMQAKEGELTKRIRSRNVLVCGQNKENSDTSSSVEHRSMGSFPEKSVINKLPTQGCLKTNISGNTNHLGISENSIDSETTRKPSTKNEVPGIGPKSNKLRDDTDSSIHGLESLRSDDTVVFKFVGTAIDGKSEAEDACHHGLVDPTINLKEAMNAINSMFREPLEPSFAHRRSRKSQPEAHHGSKNEFVVFMDESSNGTGPIGLGEASHKQDFQIFIDEDDDEASDGSGERDDHDSCEVPTSDVKPFLFLNPKDHPHGKDSPQAQFGEETVICKFVGSTILDEPKVENACHHGLVEPTVNLKQAMDDINSMFGKPIEFARATKPKKDKVQETKTSCGGFSILPDDDLENVAHPDSNKNCNSFLILPDDDLEPPREQPLASSSHKSRENDLFEPTLFTKEAMDDINKMFGMPLDF